MKNFYFEDIKQLIHLIQDIGTENKMKFYPTEDSVRLHKSIFFIYYIYLTSYSNIPEYPSEIVDVEFHALSLGPAIQELMIDMKKDNKFLESCMVQPYNIDNNLKEYIKLILVELDHIDVFTLLDISRQKKCFKKHVSDFSKIEKEDIILEIKELKKD